MVRPPQRASLLPDPCPCTSAPFLRKPPNLLHSLFLSWPPSSTRLVLLNGSHVGAGSEEAAALAVTAHEGAAELFSGQ